MWQIRLRSATSTCQPGRVTRSTTRENGMHAPRHHYASMLLDGGVSIRALAEYLGHSDPGFTLRI